MVLFSRSGNSPESLAVFEQMRRRPEARFLVVTCNPDGALNRLAAEHGEVVDSIVLHEGTCDKGLAMTASFTNMGWPIWTGRRTTSVGWLNCGRGLSA